MDAKNFQKMEQHSAACKDALDSHLAAVPREIHIDFLRFVYVALASKASREFLASLPPEMNELMLILAADRLQSYVTAVSEVTE